MLSVMERPLADNRPLLAAREELAERIARALPEDGARDLPDGLRLRRTSAPTAVTYGVADPSFCVIAQGAKEIRLGDVRYRYDTEHFLIASAELPIASRIVEASPDRPYLGVVVTLDPVLVGSVMVEAGQPAPSGPSCPKAIDVCSLDAGLLDAVLRLIRLLDSPVAAMWRKRSL
jgi:hypothetical protein